MGLGVDEEIRREIRAEVKERNRRSPVVKIITDREYQERERNGLSLLFFTKLSDFLERNDKSFKRLHAKRAAKRLRVGIGPGAIDLDYLIQQILRGEVDVVDGQIKKRGEP